MRNVRLTILFLTVFLVINAPELKSQQKAFFYEPISVIDRYSINDIKLLDWKTVSIAIVEQGHASSWKTKKVGKNLNLIAGTNDQNFNRLSLYSLNTAGALEQEKHFIYTFNGDTIVAGNPPNNKHASYSYAEISEQFQGVFRKNQPERYSYQIQDLGIKRYSWTFNEFNATYFPIENMYFKMVPKNSTIIHRRETPFLIDSTNHVLTAVYGEIDKSEKYSQYKNYEIISYDRNNSLCASFNLSFQFPRGVKNQFIVTSTKGEETLGKIIVFENRFGIRKKFSDPEKNNFEIVYCNNKGELIFHKTIKLTDHPKGNLYFHGAFGDENGINIHYNVFADQQMVGIASFDRQGNVKLYENAKSELKANQHLISGTANSSMNLNRDVLSQLLQTPGCNWGLSSKLILLGTVQLESDIVVYGQMRYSVDDPNYKVPTYPDGRPMMTGASPKINLYGELIFFRYDKEYILKSTMIQELELKNEICSISLISKFQNEAYFLIPHSSKKVPDSFKLARCMYDKNNIRHEEYNYSDLYNPMFIALEDKASNILIKDTYLLNKHGSVFAREDLPSNFIVCGFDIDEQGNHFFKIKTLDLGFVIK